MKEDDVRKIAREMIKDELLVIAKETRALAILNVEIGELLLSGLSGSENFSGSRRKVVELLEVLKTTIETMKHRTKPDKDGRQE